MRPPLQLNAAQKIAVTAAFLRHDRAGFNRGLSYAAKVATRPENAEKTPEEIAALILEDIEADDAPIERRLME